MGRPWLPPADYLRGEWFVGRASAIYDEMWQVLADLSQKRTARRVREVLEAHEPVQLPGMSDDRALMLHTVTGYSQVMAENALLAMAIYLAKHENEAPPETEG